MQINLLDSQSFLGSDLKMRFRNVSNGAEMCQKMTRSKVLSQLLPSYEEIGIT